MSGPRPPLDVVAADLLGGYTGELRAAGAANVHRSPRPVLISRLTLALDAVAWGVLVSIAGFLGYLLARVFGPLGLAGVLVYLAAFAWVFGRFFR